MTSSQIILYILIAVVFVFYLRRFLVARGIPQYSPSEVTERLKRSRDVLLLDVRTDAEWQSQHIKGAIHIPLHLLRRRIDELEKHRQREIVCYCRTGNRSLRAAARLRRLGFTSGNMKGGIVEWNFSQRQ